MRAHNIDAASRFGRRQWRRRLRVWRPWILTVAVVAVLGVAGYAVYFSSWLGVDTVRVEGAHDVPVDQVTAAADLSPGTPLARVSVETVASRVEAIPAVASATVHRAWPHTVVITIRERQPVAAVHHDGSWWVMDKTGVLYRKTIGRDPAEPIVELDGSAGPQTLPQVGAMLGAVPADLVTSTRRVKASSMDSISLLLKNGSQVTWGSASESAEKAAVLHALLKHHATVYDVSIPSQPALRD